MNLKVNHGFTLIELMVVVAIISILATLAFPSYMDSVRKSNRADAKSTMLQVASHEERYYTENNVYGSLTGIGYATSSIASQSGRHNITLTTANADSTYIITATPVASDTTCGALTLTNTGVTGSAIAGACW